MGPFRPLQPISRLRALCSFFFPSRIDSNRSWRTSTTHQQCTDLQAVFYASLYCHRLARIPLTLSDVTFFAPRVGYRQPKKELQALPDALKIIQSGKTLRRVGALSRVPRPGSPNSWLSRVSAERRDIRAHLISRANVVVLTRDA